MANKEKIGLEILNLKDFDHEVYEMPFRAQPATDADNIFVDDVRGNDDPSLGAVPRITTFAQLKEVFKLDIDNSLGWKTTPDGELYWKVIGFYVRSGTAAFIPKVFDQNGQPLPHPGAFVFAHWPGALNLSPPPNPHYHGNGVGGFTNENGDVGFGYSGGAAIGGNGGPYTIWVSADPPHGTRFHSDAGIRLGWHGATDHLTPNPIFQAVRKADTTPPPSAGQAELRVFDEAGLLVGYTPLITGQGTGGRIALFDDGQEQGYTILK